MKDSRTRAVLPALVILCPRLAGGAGLAPSALKLTCVEACNDPQLEAWLRTGAVTSYRVLMNQNPTGGTWGVMFIYEYPSWELLGETKGAIRTSGRVTLAERLEGHR